MIVLDTHTFVWLVEGSRKLGTKARRRVEREASRGQVHVSAFSFWELSMLVEAGRLRMSSDVADVRATALRSGATEIALDGEIGILAARLGGLHGDPADRIIVATALVRRAVLLTADDALLDMKGGPTRIDARE
jgi:PIN domain nuclease of toxin-antitoxin system